VTCARTRRARYVPILYLVVSVCRHTPKLDESSMSLLATGEGGNHLSNLHDFIPCSKREQIPKAQCGN
jgi:hypothetical protein